MEYEVTQLVVRLAKVVREALPEAEEREKVDHIIRDGRKLLGLEYCDEWPEPHRERWITDYTLGLQLQHFRHESD